MSGRGLTPPPADCQDVVERTTDLLEAHLDPATAVQVDDHLLECEGCAEYVDQIRRTVATLGVLGRPEHEEPVPRDLRRRLMASFRQTRETRQTRRR